MAEGRRAGEIYGAPGIETGMCLVYAIFASFVMAKRGAWWGGFSAKVPCSRIQLNMAFSNDQLNDIYDRTSGYCHICHRKLAFSNYGLTGARSAWEVEHSRPQCQSGSNRLCNLYPACIQCNRSKGAESTRTVRARNGLRRAPMNWEKRREVKQQRAAVGAVIGGVAGAALLGPFGALAGGVIGAKFGEAGNPDRE